MKKFLLILLVFASCQNATPPKKKSVKTDIIKKVVPFVYLSKEQESIDSLIQNVNKDTLFDSMDKVNGEDGDEMRYINLNKKLNKRYSGKTLKNFLVSIVDIHHEKTGNGLIHLVFVAKGQNQGKCVFEMDYPFISEDEMFNSEYYKILAPKVDKIIDTMSFYIQNINVATLNNSWYDMKLYDMNLAPPGVVKFSILPKVQ